MPRKKNFKKISTHLLTVLTKHVILQIEQRKQRLKVESVHTVSGSSIQIFDDNVHLRRNRYVNAYDFRNKLI